MTSIQIVFLATLGLCFGGLIALFVFVAAYARELQGELRERNKETRQLLDRLATHEYAKKDAIIPRIFSQMPPSVQEEAAVSGPHGAGQNEVVDLSKKPVPPKPAPKPQTTRRYKLDVAEEFGRPEGKSN